MSLLTHFNNNSIKQRLRHANYWAKKNHNSYPIQIDKLTESKTCKIYEWIECPCGQNCECKKYGCKKHYVRMNDEFDDVFEHFLNCYVNKKKHSVIKLNLAGKKINKNDTRIKNIPALCNYVEKNWEKYRSTKIKTNLLCSKWLYTPFDSCTGLLKMTSDSIFHSKWLSILNMGTFVAFDTNSLRLIKKDYSKSTNYKELLAALRIDLQCYLSKNGVTIDDFLMNDKPSEFFKGISISPRPLGNILDKLYLTL
jgi:hypothetical protein